ncbi:hypothetical protein ACO2Q1_16875 [Brevundimonas sp. VNH65]|uniref:hypothetical protein n=1 Tax=Brevundimonas sp. VNH65 TaxID=3400917 RepID=UPI003C11C5CE
MFKVETRNIRNRNQTMDTALAGGSRVSLMVAGAPKGGAIRISSSVDSLAPDHAPVSLLATR